MYEYPEMTVSVCGWGWGVWCFVCVRVSIMRAQAAHF